MGKTQEQKPKIRAKQLREVATNLKKFSYKDIFQLFDITEGNEKNRVRRRFQDFLRRGELKRIAPGVFKYMGPDPYRGKPLCECMWRAMRILKRFTAEEIARNTGASINYVQRYIKKLRNIAYIQVIGKKKADTNKPVNVYQIKNNIQKMPPISIFKSPDPYQPIRNMAWQFIRPVIEGSIQKNEVIRQETIQLGEKLLEKIRKMGESKDEN